MDWYPNLRIERPVFDEMWRIIDEACVHWGEGVLTSTFAPTWASNAAYAEVLPGIERACMSPGMARSVLQGYHGMDVREAAAAVHVPTLVLHCEDDRMLPYVLGADLARRIDGARLVTLRGADHFAWIHNSDAVVDAIEEFVTGRALVPHDDDRILTTIVFTDIVDSTARLAGAGDVRRRALLAEHDRRMDGLLARFGGEHVKHTGDGRLVHFTRPARAVRFASAMTEAARSGGLEIHSGLHTGECEVVGGDLIGLAVNVAARVAATARPNEVLVSSTVRDLVIGSGLDFSPAGGHDLKGVPGRWELHRYERDRPGPLVSVGYETDVRQPGT